MMKRGEKSKGLEVVVIVLIASILLAFVKPDCMLEAGRQLLDADQMLDLMARILLVAMCFLLVIAFVATCRRETLRQAIGASTITYAVAAGVAGYCGSVIGKCLLE